MDTEKQDAVTELMQKLAQITTDLIDDVEVAFIECLQRVGVDPVEHVDYVNSETSKWLQDVSHRADAQHRFRLMMREYRKEDVK